MSRNQRIPPVLVITQDEAFANAYAEWIKGEKRVIVRLDLNKGWRTQVKGNNFSRVVIDEAVKPLIDSDLYGVSFYSACNTSLKGHAFGFGIHPEKLMIVKSFDYNQEKAA